MRTLSLVVVFALATAPASAQNVAQSGVAVGARVRVSTRDLPSVRLASVTGITSDSIALSYARGFGEVQLPVGSIARLWVSEGPRSRAEGARHGAKRGFVTGLVLGGIAAAVTIVACSGKECFGADSYGLLVAPLLVATSAAAGATFGVVAPGERWRRVRLTP